jgi:hypothetical protein
MNWQSIVQYLNLTLGIVLIIKLFSAKLYRIYELFCLFLAADLLGSALWISDRTWGLLSDNFYVLAWLIIRPGVWVFTLLMVYSLLEKILSQLPGLLRLSKRILHTTFFLALMVGVVSARLEYSAPGFIAFDKKQFLIRWWITELVLDRVITSIVLLSLIAILAFLLWFPVTIPRNLAVFSIGFAVYFAGGTVLMLFRSFWPSETVPSFSKLTGIVDILLGGVSSICYVFWLFRLSPAGEAVPSVLTIQRQPQEQERLIAQLELINDTLLKAARR